MDIIVTILVYFLIAFVSYFIGTINFSKIIAWRARNKDITKIGSKNPGAMNMLRSFGFWLALATFLAEVVKAGLVCFIVKITTQGTDLPLGGDFMYFYAGLFLMLGYNFPVLSKFKGGKGVACFSGIFLFSNIWYIALAWFVVCFVLLILIDYGSVISFIYIGGLTIAMTIYLWLAMELPLIAKILITVIIWFLYILVIYKHKENIKRLLNHTENKVGFKSKLKHIFSHKKGEVIIDEENVDHPAEKEIIIDDDDKK
jgi:glycerol-3-phosphate acyltransferase PlsY